MYHTQAGIDQSHSEMNSQQMNQVVSCCIHLCWYLLCSELISVDFLMGDLCSQICLTRAESGLWTLSWAFGARWWSSGDCGNSSASENSRRWQGRERERDLYFRLDANINQKWKIDDWLLLHIQGVDVSWLEFCSCFCTISTARLAKRQRIDIGNLVLGLGGSNIIVAAQLSMQYTFQKWYTPW